MSKNTNNTSFNCFNSNSGKNKTKTLLDGQSLPVSIASTAIAVKTIPAVPLSPSATSFNCFNSNSGKNFLGRRSNDMTFIVSIASTAIAVKTVRRTERSEAWNIVSIASTAIAVKTILLQHTICFNTGFNCFNSNSGKNRRS